MLGGKSLGNFTEFLLVCSSHESLAHSGALDRITRAARHKSLAHSGALDGITRAARGEQLNYYTVYICILPACLCLLCCMVCKCHVPFFVMSLKV